MTRKEGMDLSIVTGLVIQDIRLAEHAAKDGSYAGAAVKLDQAIEKLRNLRGVFTKRYSQEKQQ